MNLIDSLKKVLTPYTCSANGKFSVTKTGASIAGLGGTIIGLPIALNAVGASSGVEINIVLPVVVAAAAKWMIGIGGYMAIIGGRNAIDKIKK
jgi:hypothetical protein